MLQCPFNKPKWEPMFWNNLREQDANISNCYSYALNYVEKNTDPDNMLKIQPGDISNSNVNNLTCRNIIKNIESDYNIELRPVRLNEPLLCNHYRIAIVLDNEGDHRDYHLYRQDMDNRWSHKQGKGKIKRYDSSFKPIYDPKVANRNYSTKDDLHNDKYNYSIFCGYFSIPYNGGPFYRNI